MAWVELGAEAPELALKANGDMEWNAALQILMANPQWVRLMWSAAERRLGLRGINAPGGLPVSAEPETGEYKVDSADILGGVGISVDENYAAEPESWQQMNAGDGWAQGFGLNPIFYITLPE